MRRLGFLALIASAVVIAAACAATPKARWAQARSGLTTSQMLLLDANTAGQVSDETMLDLDPWIQSGERALTVARTYLPEGGPMFDHLLSIVDAVLQALVTASAEGRAALPPPPVAPGAAPAPAL